MASIRAAAAVPAITGAPSEYRVGNLSSDDDNDDEVHTAVDDEVLLFNKAEWESLVLVIVGDVSLRAIPFPGGDSCNDVCIG